MSTNKFWNKFEECLEKNVARKPEDYFLMKGESSLSYAKRTRTKMQMDSDINGLNIINLNSLTFKHVYASYRPGVSFSQRGLKDLYYQLTTEDFYSDQDKYM